MRGDQTAQGLFPKNCSGSGASGSGFIGIGVDFGLRDRGMIGVFLPTCPAIRCDRWPGLFGIGVVPEQLFGIGAEALRKVGISLKKGSPRILLLGAAPYPYNCSYSPSSS